MAAKKAASKIHTDPNAVTKMVKALALFIDCIDFTGGIMLDEGKNPVPCVDPEWYDLGDAYVQACEALGRTPKGLPRAEPTFEQVTAVIAYAKEKGKDWKAKLNADWLRAAAMIKGRHSPLLQQVRNQFGPEWLAKFDGRRYQLPE